jgi:uncharacterized protein involved in response to NO
MPRSLLLPSGASEAAPTSLAISAKGFRLFFLLAAAFAVAIVPLWLLVLRGMVRPAAYLQPTVWHAHEMLFGFVVAVIAGFLLTAVSNWTSRETVVGVPLMLLAGLWLLGRVAMVFSAALPPGVTALVDLAFLPVLAVVLARPLLSSRNRRNFVMLLIVGALSVANAVVHLDALGVLAPGSAHRACSLSVDLVVLMILIISGRVFPMFTRNATGVNSIRSIFWLDVATVGGMAVLTAVDALAGAGLANAALAGAVGLLAAARAIHWGARHSFRQPLLWILHAGYAWLVFGLLFRAVAGFGWPSFASLATHALTVGAVGCLTLGMMARVSLGHTGRMLVAPAPLAWAFVAINLAAVARTLIPLVAPARYFDALVAAGAFWTTAFVLFLAVYLPILLRPRIDGRPG